MKILLIRHGETVDNIAGLYAGVKDSALTNHGVEQAKRLGAYLAGNDEGKTGPRVKISHVFASPLQRADKTARAIVKAQVEVSARASASPKDWSLKRKLEIVKVADLIEQDFGYYEGKPFYARSSASPKKSGREAHHAQHKDHPGFVDVETKASMNLRADKFLDEHLVPLLLSTTMDEQQEVNIAVVSHGMLLSHLWRRLLLRLPRRSLTIAPEVTAVRDALVLEHLGGWSNTGYLELELRKELVASTPAQDKAAQIPAVSSAQTEAASLKSSMAALPVPEIGPPILPTGSEAEVTSPSALDGSKSEISANMAADRSDGPSISPLADTAKGPQLLSSFTTVILAVDSKAHLVGLKRQRGGIGRLAHDEGQKKLEGFFKRVKKDDG